MKPLTKNILFTEIETMRNAVTAERFSVDGFQFVLDNPENKTFNPHCIESAAVAGFPVQNGMPSVAGFFYISDAYQNYLQALAESGQKHPAEVRDAD